MLANEKEQFDLNDVINAQSKKLIHRHPHIYSNTKVENVKDVKKNWELLKLKENKKKSVLSGVPTSLPAMLKSYRVLEKVKGIGFDFSDAAKSFDKVIEEIYEFKSELEKDNLERAKDELGDIIFSIIGFGQKIGINSIDALEKTNKKFISRFQKMEKLINKTTKSISNYSSDELDEFWNQTKN